MVSADIQLGIVNFLEGESLLLRSSCSVDPLASYNFSSSKEEMKIELLNRMADECERIAMDNGFSFPDRCQNCPAYEKRSNEVYMNHVDHSFCYTSVRRCRNGGCHEARENFLKNTEKLKLKGKLKIDLEIDARLPEPVRVLGGMSVFRGRSEPELSIKATRKKEDSGYEDFFTTGKVSSYSKPHTTSKAELDALEEIILSEPTDYGITAW